MAIAFTFPSLIPTRLLDPTQMLRVVSAVSSRPPLRCRVTWSDNGLLTRKAHVQVVNGAGGHQGVGEGGVGGRPCLGMFAVLVVVGVVEDDSGAGEQTLGSPSEGGLISELVQDRVAVYFTNRSGVVAFDITQTGSWTARSVRAIVLGPADGTDTMIGPLDPAGAPGLPRPPYWAGGSGGSPNLDGGHPDSNYGGIAAIDCGGVV